MKTLLKNKRLISGLVATTLGVAILVMSLSFAWFTSDGSAANTITLGSLKVTGGFYSLNEQGDQNYPGTQYYHDQAAWLKKDGNLQGFVQLDMYGILTQDPALGNGSGKVDWVSIKEEGVPAFTNSAGVDIPAKAHELGVWYNLANDDCYTWFIGADGKYYVEIDGNDRIHVGYDVDIPTDLGNAWQGAALEIKFDWLAVQARPQEAAVEVFGSAVPKMVMGFIDEGMGPVPAPIIDGTAVPNSSGVPVGKAYFELLKGFFVYDPADGPQLNPNGDGVYFSAFSVGVEPLKAFEAYVQGLADDFWVKHVLIAEFGFDF